MTERTSHESKYALAAVAGLAMAFATVGCGSAEKHARTVPADPPNERIVVVSLEVDAAGNATKILDAVSDDKDTNGKVAIVSKKQRDAVHWVVYPPYANVQMKVEPKPNSIDTCKAVFPNGIAHHGKHALSDVVNKDVKDKTICEYFVRVVNGSGAGGPKDLDPIIRVDP